MMLYELRITPIKLYDLKLNETFGGNNYTSIGYQTLKDEAESIGVVHHAEITRAIMRNEKSAIYELWCNDNLIKLNTVIVKEKTRVYIDVYLNEGLWQGFRNTGI
jgi:hypothetical protein